MELKGNGNLYWPLMERRRRGRYTIVFHSLTVHILATQDVASLKTSILDTTFTSLCLISTHHNDILLSASMEGILHVFLGTKVRAIRHIRACEELP